MTSIPRPWQVEGNCTKDQVLLARRAYNSTIIASFQQLSLLASLKEWDSGWADIVMQKEV